MKIDGQSQAETLTADEILAEQKKIEEKSQKEEVILFKVLGAFFIAAILLGIGLCIWAGKQENINPLIKKSQIDESSESIKEVRTCQKNKMLTKHSTA